ncbi:argininosuccinate lyase [Muribaculum sp.]|uniref:argininosuccinate lyase n=1 Tax=Muribaculum sp. TaxID=1918611 RepID=UPI00258D4760|nr:argininosuccinate lyase [Muribaculum sp.]MCX4277561.1 argininosuccinate lyase [Muribaculum sp.]
MKLWSKGFEPDKMIEQFTVGNDRELDLRLARYDVQGSMAHIRMLESIGLLKSDELEVLLKALGEIAEVIERGEFRIEDGVEDVHSQVEFMLTARLGDIGKKIHSGRSRNDQVLVDLKLFMRDELRRIAKAVERLFTRLQTLSEEHKDKLMPGYTHLQVAMPSSFGLWFGAYAESLVDDMQMLAAAYNVANQNPLGSAAGYGSSFPLDREMTTRLLGFETLHYNVVAAQMSRGKTERAASMAIASIASTLGHLAMDVCMWMCQNFGFVSFPDELTTGSSIMPHKKNPDVFEIMRGKCNRLQSVPNEIALLTANLPLGYNRDLQLLKDIIFPATTELIECLDMAEFMLRHIRVRDGIVNDPRYDYLFTVEEVNRLVLEGMPFREAYKKVGLEVQDGSYRPVREVHHTHAGSISNLCNEEIARKFHSIADRIV